VFFDKTITHISVVGICTTRRFSSSCSWQTTSKVSPSEIQHSLHR